MRRRSEEFLAVLKRMTFLAGLAILLAACAPQGEHGGGRGSGREWSFPEYELTLRLPEHWVVQDVYALYAQQAGVPETEARALPLAELVRRTRLLLLGRPGPESGASEQCVVMVQTEDLSRFPGVQNAEGYAALAEEAVKRHMPGYERLTQDTPVKAGAAAGLRRECRADQMLGGIPRAVRNLTLFLKRDSVGIAVGAYELEERFAARKSEFEGILASVRLGTPPPDTPWARLVRRLIGYSSK